MDIIFRAEGRHLQDRVSRAAANYLAITRTVIPGKAGSALHSPQSEGNAS